MAATGAEALIEALGDAGVKACFANPGTSEMHFVAALDRSPRIRSVLCLFEGVATGAADGYGRMAGHPAATLLHLGPGYANGAANLHNAGRAGTPIVNIVGEHARDHRAHDTPLASDIAALARLTSLWVDTAEDPEDLAALAHEAVTQSLTAPRGPVSLIVPADCAWEAVEVRRPLAAWAPPEPAVALDLDRVMDEIWTAHRPALVLGSSAITAQSLAAAERLQAAGVAIYCDTFVSRLPRGAGVFAPQRLPYLAEAASQVLAGHDLLVLAGTSPPAAFFAYPDRPSLLAPPTCQVLPLCQQHEDAVLALAWLAEQVTPFAPEIAAVPPVAATPTGPVTPATVGASLARHLPQHAIVSDDAVTSGGPVYMATEAAAPHDWLMLTGGAIGQGLPVALGAAVACPDRKVVCLTGDGAALYTVQTLWSLAREALDVVVVVFANNAYRILDMEMARTGAPRGQGPVALLSLDDPSINWTAMADAYGVASQTCASAEAFDAAFAQAMRVRGPHLIVAQIP